MEKYNVTPWRSEEEWLEVGHLIISDNESNLLQAYEKMQIWKSRCNRVPAGIECSMILLEPILGEQSLLTLNNDIIIKSVYATAITRFLNVATSFNKEKMPASLYRIAESLNITEWVVNARHEVAHGSDIPPLEVLKAGVQFTLNWLRCVYWGIGLKDGPREDYIVYRFDSELQRWVVIYQAVIKQKMKNVLLTENLDPELVQHIKEYIMSTDGSGPVYYSEEYEELPSTINLLLGLLVRKLNCLYLKATKGGNRVEEFIRSFLMVSEFVPSKKALEAYKSSKDEPGKGTTYLMKQLWRRVIWDVFQDNDVLLELLKELVYFDSGDHVRDYLASCWVREISMGIHIAQVTLQIHLMNHSRTHVKERTYYTAEQQRLIYKTSRGFYSPASVWNKTMKLSLNNIPKTEDLVEYVVMKPRKYCRIFLESLMKTLKHQPSKAKVERIKQIIDLILLQTTYVGYRYPPNEMIHTLRKPEDGVRVAKENEIDSGVSSAWKGVPFGSKSTREDGL